jgi:hypothetical protein
MSEYQYYEFQAVDRPLDADARAALYYANWGSYTVMLRLPLAGLTLAEVEPYLTDQDEGFSAWDTKEHVILRYEAREEGGGFYEDERGGSLASIIPIRNELLNGDLRPLYLGWLLAVQQMYDEGEDIVEPPVPPGLKSLSGPQQALAEFLGIDPDLIAIAAENSADLRPTLDPGEATEQAEWVRALPAGEKDDCLLRLLRGEATAVGMHLQRRYRDEQLSKKRKGRPDAAEPGLPRRSVAELRARAEGLEAERAEQERQKKQRQRDEEQRRQAELRERRLASLAGSEESLWKQVESLVATKLPRKYDEAVSLLVDLRDLAGRAGTTAAFEARLRTLRERHAAKRTFLQRLDKKGLP